MEVQKNDDAQQKEPHAEQPVKRGRGRPKGSKNKSLVAQKMCVPAADAQAQ